MPPENISIDEELLLYKGGYHLDSIFQAKEQDLK